MKAFLSLFIFVLFVFIYSGCTDDNSIVTPPNQESAEIPVYVPWSGFNFGLVLPQTWNCGTNTFGRLQTGLGKSSHLGRTTSELKYCIQFTGLNGGIILPSGDTSVVKNFNNQEIWLYITGGTFNIVDTVMLNDTAFMKIELNITGDIFGGTGRFNNADGEASFEVTQFTKVNNPSLPSAFYMRWTGTLKRQH
jgi:hypothetical protein